MPRLSLLFLFRAEARRFPAYINMIETEKKAPRAG
jgi:hypothetical protein